MATATPRPRLIRMPELLILTGFTNKSSIYPLYDSESESYDCTFPTRVKLGPRTVAWYEAEVLEWLQNRPRVVAKKNKEGV